MDDGQLLREYVVNQSEAAFRTLVERYIRLVYGAALRQLDNPSQAEDVAQAVFIVLARKAPALPRGTILSGWLYRATHFTADKARRAEYRRQQREQEAFQMQSTVNDPDWASLAPVLDDAMARLQQTDRTAILLRFFENKSLRDVGRALGISEDNAQKRVSRAIAKLRGLLVKEGVTVSSAAMTASISAHALPIVPAQISAKVAAAGLGHQAVPAAIQGLAKTAQYGWSWPKALAAGLVGFAFLATGLIVSRSYLHHHSARSPTAGFTPGPAAIRLRVPGATPVPNAPGTAAIRLDLAGTPGLRFDAVYSHDGETQTTSGVLPAEISFQADAFNASFKLRDPGQFGFDIYLNNRIAARRPISAATTNRTYLVETLAVRRGFRFSVK